MCTLVLVALAFGAGARPAGAAPAIDRASVEEQMPIDDLVRAYRAGPHEGPVAVAALWSDERISREIARVLAEDAAREAAKEREVRVLPSLDIVGLDRGASREDAVERESRRLAAAAVLAESAVARLRSGDPRPLGPRLWTASALLGEAPWGGRRRSFARGFYLLAAFVLHWHVEIAAGHRLLATALRQFPDDPELHTALGSMLETVASLRTYASSSPERSPGAITSPSGGYSSETGEEAGALPGATLGEAEAHYERALTVDPGIDEGRLRLARVRLLSGRAEEALRDLERVATEASQPRHRYLAALFAGAARQQQGDVAGAVAAYRACLAQGPRAQTLLLALGHALDRLGDKPGAQEALAAASAVGGPFDPWWSYRFGQPERIDELVARLRALVE
jgi:tetratricopeptide (TPR) repeat protein